MTKRSKINPDLQQHIDHNYNLLDEVLRHFVILYRERLMPGPKHKNSLKLFGPKVRTDYTSCKHITVVIKLAQEVYYRALWTKKEVFASSKWQENNKDFEYRAIL